MFHRFTLKYSENIYKLQISKNPETKKLIKSELFKAHHIFFLVYIILTCNKINIFIFKNYFPGRPDQVHNCTITNISMTSMGVRCSEGFNGGLPQTFMVEVRDSHTTDLRANYSSPLPRFTVNSLMPGAVYLASIFAFNSKGRSDPTIVQVSMLRLPEKQQTSEKGKFIWFQLLNSSTII